MNEATAAIVWPVVVGSILIAVIGGILTGVSVRMNKRRLEDIQREYPGALGFTVFASSRANAVLRRMLRSRSVAFRRLPQRSSILIREGTFSIVRRTGESLETVFAVPTTEIEAVATGSEMFGRATYATLIFSIIGTGTTYSLELRLAGPKGVGNATSDFARAARDKIVRALDSDNGSSI